MIGLGATWGSVRFANSTPRLLTAVALRLKSIGAPVLFGGEQVVPVTQTGASICLAKILLGDQPRDGTLSNEDPFRILTMRSACSFEQVE